jgi:tartrate dehydratase alpha subunit/fumarate hydratase class I-like protein
LSHSVGGIITGPGGFGAGIGATAQQPQYVQQAKQQQNKSIKANNPNKGIHQIAPVLNPQVNSLG